jgi:hypothetical protein
MPARRATAPLRNVGGAAAGDAGVCGRGERGMMARFYELVLSRIMAPIFLNNTHEFMVNRY